MTILHIWSLQIFHGQHIGSIRCFLDASNFDSAPRSIHHKLVSDLHSFRVTLIFKLSSLPLRMHPPWVNPCKSTPQSPITSHYRFLISYQDLSRLSTPSLGSMLSAQLPAGLVQGNLNSSCGSPRWKCPPSRAVAVFGRARVQSFTSM